MKFTILFVLLASVIGSAYAESSCIDKAKQKKLAGAAYNSFMKKCENDAKASCEKDKISMKTFGAAKSAHVNKCVKEAVGR